MIEKIGYFLVIFFMCCQFSHCQAKDNNLFDSTEFKVKNYETSAIENYVLDSGYVVKTVNVSTDEECMVECVLRDSCFSYNLGPATQSGTSLCELNRLERFRGLKHWITKPGWTHRSILTGCSDVSKCTKDEFCIPDLNTTMEFMCPPIYLDIEVKAYGYDDQSRAPNGDMFTGSCFKINSKIYPVKKNGRGHNFLSLTTNGTIISTASYDTMADSHASTKIAVYINGLPTNTIVLVAVVDSGDNYENVAEVQSIGGANPLLAFRESYALIGLKNADKPSWIKEVKKTNGAGPSIATARISVIELYKF